MSKPKTAMVVANSANLRNELRERVCREGELEVIASSPRGELAVHRLKRSKPDVAVVSANLDGHELNKLAADLRKHSPGLLVIIYDVNAAPDSGRFETQSDLLERRSTLQAITAFSVRDSTERSTPGPLHTGIVDSESAGPDHNFEQRRVTTVLRSQFEAVVIGVSTGGAAALRELLLKLPDNPPPIFVVQHLMTVDASPFVFGLDRDCSFDVVEAMEGCEVHDSGCWVAPYDQQMRLQRDSGKVEVVLDRYPRAEYARPSIDILFESAADIYGERLLAALITGVGHDGLNGCRTIREAGGHVIVQERETSSSRGTSGAVSDAGLADEVVPRETIGQTISQRLRSSRKQDTALDLRTLGDV